ncbi:hypothetical protein PR003_g4777 [Phytophthora rubi]|uniref:BED-type domain-containing protein n=2 Tax=Phytophthora TaxID=4783 RepID=A0A6A4FLB4_9STRA|nr:hypothetical protein PR002_g4465 [Phytophthora rubi]KAE9346353.1 hypothetical protein PF008_g8325 [Phytophthora fragariae]KAE9351683.1 hypothetical protein PR003_g4777 [Phytophthora rubi]
MDRIDTLLQAQRFNEKFSPKQVAQFSFKRIIDGNDDPTGYFECKGCGKTRKQAAATGYSNLMSHVCCEHATYEREMEAAAISATGTLIP